MMIFTKKTNKKILGCTLLLLSILSLKGFNKSEVYATETNIVQGQQEQVANEENLQPPISDIVFINEVKIENKKIKINAKMEGISSSDNNVYLFEIKPYEDAVGNRKDYLKKISKKSSLSVDIDLLEGSDKSRLYSSFVFAVKVGDEYREISNRMYITNPESIAKSKKPYEHPITKKGLLIELAMLQDAFELGVKHAIVNIDVSQFLGEGIKYEYDGKTYNFSALIVDGYDKTISAMTGKSMQVTAVVLNSYNENMKELIYPGLSKNKAAHYYGFNVSTKEGYETTRAIASFLAERYSGENPNYGRISNWVIGNEINNNATWNYMGNMDIDTYVKEYERAFRVFYTAMKSHSANCRMFYSIDYDWNFVNASNKKYKAKDIVDKFNEAIKQKGNIDWNLAYHPYPLPLTSPIFWDDVNTGQIKNDPSSQVINFSNLNVLTDYLCQDSFKNSKNEVRRVILSEQGFTSMLPGNISNNDLQAAAFAFAYYIVDSNPYIDAFILSRQVDAIPELRDSLALGLWTVDVNQPNKTTALQRKKIWVVFKHIDSNKYSLEQTEFAKKVIGIKKWSDVVPNFRYKNKE